MTGRSLRVSLTDALCENEDRRGTPFGKVEGDRNRNGQESEWKLLLVYSSGKCDEFMYWYVAWLHFPHINGCINRRNIDGNATNGEHYLLMV
jgi:hypothetical protein